MDRPVAEVTDTEERTYLVDGLTGQPRGPIEKKEALNIAEQAWIDGEPDFTSVAKITQSSVEYRGALPASRVSTDAMCVSSFPWPQVKSLLSAVLPGGFMISSGHSILWTGKTTRISIVGGSLPLR